MIEGRRIEVTYSAAKAWAGGVVAGLVGLLAPGAAYLLTVDHDGITGTEWQHAGLIAVVAAAGAGAAVGATVYRVENKPRERDLGPSEELADPPGGSWVQ